jgi:uncharacterized protein YraI
MISRKTTISAAALLLASAGAAAAFPATATTDLNVRSGPGTGYSVIDQLQAGDTVEIVETRGSWYQTAQGGWASGNFLDAEGGQTSYYGGGDYGDYGPAAFYYDENPYFWDDAGFYFFIDGGRRHRVGWDWFRDRDHRHLRWANARYRRDFENRRGDWDRRADVTLDQRQRLRRSDADVSADVSVEDRRRVRRGEADVSADAEPRQLRTGRASAGGEGRMEGGPRRGGGGGGEGPRIQRGGGGGGGGGGAVLPPRDLPSGGY